MKQPNTQKKLKPTKKNPTIPLKNPSKLSAMLSQRKRNLIMRKNIINPIIPFWDNLWPIRVNLILI